MTDPSVAIYEPEGQRNGARGALLTIIHEELGLDPELVLKDALGVTVLIDAVHNKWRVRVTARAQPPVENTWRFDLGSQTVLLIQPLKRFADWAKLWCGVKEDAIIFSTLVVFDVEEIVTATIKLAITPLLATDEGQAKDDMIERLEARCTELYDALKDSLALLDGNGGNRMNRVESARIVMEGGIVPKCHSCRYSYPDCPVAVGNPVCLDTSKVSVVDGMVTKCEGYEHRDAPELDAPEAPKPCICGEAEKIVVEGNNLNVDHGFRVLCLVCKRWVYVANPQTASDAVRDWNEYVSHKCASCQYRHQRATCPSSTAVFACANDPKLKGAAADRVLKCDGYVDEYDGDAKILMTIKTADPVQGPPTVEAGGDA